MASHFEFATTGPLPLEHRGGELRPDALRDLWRANKELKSAIGVYILVAEVNRRLVPLYVGRSDDGFAKRLSKQHAVFGKIPSRYQRCDLYLFLIARVTAAKREPKRASRRYVERGDDVRRAIKRLKSISTLESQLIAKCAVLNPEILNIKEVAFHKGFVVPGVSGDADEPRTNSAEALRGMLASKRIAP